MAIEHFLYTVVDADFYESLDYYTPDPNAYLRHVRKLLPPQGWEVERSGLWHSCSPSGVEIPEQGWKIHLSATLANAGGILVTAARVLIAERTAFKFACDRFLFYLLNSKRWNRGGSGKFITIYPPDAEAFRTIIEKLYRALAGYQGPYILSDRQYRDSPVIYYRYGGFKRMPQLTVKGTSRLMIKTPDGGWTEDHRQAYYCPPPWASDPLGARSDQPPPSRQLKDGRYTIDGVLTFSNSGGVYLATDRDTGARVVIKEARPLSNVYLNGYDAVVLLKKEHRLLSQLEPLRVGPQPLDFFKEWEHWFLVMEYVEGTPLRGKSTESNITLCTQPTLADVEKFCDYFRRTYGRITELIRTLHEHNIVFTDLSHHNVIWRRATGDPVLIDFEAAYERGIDDPTPMFTPGFASEQQQNMAVATFEDDLYALGALMVASLTPMMAMSSLCPEAHERFLTMLVRDFGLPPAIQQVISGLMHATPGRRPKPAEVLALLSEDWSLRPPAVTTYEGEAYCTPALVKRIVSHILASATYERGDRLFPSDPEMFATNPLGVAYGASGVAYALKEVTGEVPDRAVRWILAHECSPAEYPPGLYVGLSGVAWTLLVLGQEQRARELAAMAHEHPLALDSSDVFYGLAGTGLSQLKMFANTGDERFLAWALETADRLLALRQQDDTGCWWPYMGEIYYGMAHGASGVALFFLYLYLATQEERFLEVARRGLDYDLANARRSREGALTWTMGGTSRTVTPYWRHGGAGVGTAMLRYYCVTGDARFKNTLDEIVGDCDRKYTIFPSRLFGLTGCGDFLLDMAACFPEEPSYRQMAMKIASGLSFFRVERPHGTSFPGEELVRLSCDYGTGSAGIALFLHRLLNGDPTPYMVDELLAGRSARPLVATPPALTVTGG